MKIALTFLLTLVIFKTHASDYRLQKVKVLGPMKHKVIFQSIDLKKVKGTNVLKGKLVAQWGLHVFEVVNGFYACNKNNFCKLSDYERIATFESCVVKSKVKVECRKKLAGEFSSGSPEILIYDNPDYVGDEFSHERNNDEYTDFPVRIKDEFDDLF